MIFNRIAENYAQNELLQREYMTVISTLVEDKKKRNFLQVSAYFYNLSTCSVKGWFTRDFFTRDFLPNGNHRWIGTLVKHPRMGTQSH